MEVVLDEIFKSIWILKFYGSILTQYKKISEMVSQLMPTRSRKISLEVDLLKHNSYWNIG